MSEQIHHVLERLHVATLHQAPADEAVASKNWWVASLVYHTISETKRNDEK